MTLRYQNGWRSYRKLKVVWWSAWLSLVVFAAPARTQNAVPASEGAAPMFAALLPKQRAPNWDREALQNLRVLDAIGAARPIDPTLLFGGDGWRCPRLNNYWCIKAARLPWPGMIGQDEDGHAMFKAGVYSAAAMAQLMRQYYTLQDRRTVRKIACRFAPDQDCVGSGRGRTSSGTCAAGRNRCDKYADALAAALKTCADCDVGLFGSDGKPLPPLKKLMSVMAMKEISHAAWNVDLVPTDALVENGIDMANR